MLTPTDLGYMRPQPIDLPDHAWDNVSQKANALHLRFRWFMFGMMVPISIIWLWAGK